MDKKYDAASLVFCLFNSMTLAECEFHGRYYGGGVSELTPSEFKNITLPYCKISKEYICKLDKKFKNNEPLKDIIEFVNEKTICKRMEKEEVEVFEKIRKKLILRRS